MSATDLTYVAPVHRPNVCRLAPDLASRVPIARKADYLALASWGAIMARMAPEPADCPERVACRGLLRALLAYAEYAHHANLEAALWRTCELWSARVRSFA